MGTVRWDVVARGLGCEGLYAESLAGVEAALARARDVAGPGRRPDPHPPIHQSKASINPSTKRASSTAAWASSRVYSSVGMKSSSP